LPDFPTLEGQETAMKYFTPDLIERLNSLDDEVADAAYREWECAIVRARRRWRQIKAAFPREVRRFQGSPVCLHDARVLRMGQQGDIFLFVLEPEPPAQDVAVLTFTLLGVSVIDRAALPGRQETGSISWLYEEFDLDRAGKCGFEVVLSNGWSVKLRFRRFRFVVVQRLLPEVDGQVIPERGRLVSGPA
jgi:hypothetical protein